tara:strand:+ start:3358 stop:4128 length:771 start_codon:yes stop_codon:yes gene_type:complete
MDICYSFYKLENLGCGYFDDSIETVFVIVCCFHNNYYRYNDVVQKIKTQRIHKNCIIVRNKGYKNCNKSLTVTNSTYDLSHAVKTICEYARNMKNILILEDDFFFDKQRLEDSHKSINNFLKFQAFDIYSFGSATYLCNPFNVHQRCVGLHSSAAFVYSLRGRKRFIENYEANEGKVCADLWTYSYPTYLFYRYYIPICYQLFNETENKKVWANPLANSIIKLIGIDKKYQPGWDIIYFLNILSFILVFIIVMSKV